MLSEEEGSSSQYKSQDKNSKAINAKERKKKRKKEKEKERKIYTQDD